MDLATSQAQLMASIAQLQKYMSDTARDIETAMANIARSIGSTIASISTSMTSGMASIADSISSTIASINASVASGMASIAGSISATIPAVSADVASGTGVIASGVNTAISSISTGISTGIIALVAMLPGPIRLLAALGNAVSLEKFTEFIKVNIDTVGSLTDLSTRTRISVEDLAGLSYGANLSGKDLETAAGAIAQLSANMGKDADKFTKLGITAKDPMEAFKQLADIYKSIEDPQKQAAFGADTLGMSWQTSAVLLSKGSAGLTELMAHGLELSGVTTKISGDAADFNDKLAEMNTMVDGVGIRLAGVLLPTLNDFAATLLDVFKKIGLVDQVVKVFTDDNLLSRWADHVAMGLARVVDVILLIPRLLSAVSGSFKVVGADIEVMARKAVTLNPLLAGASLALGVNPFAELKKAMENRNQILADANAKWSDLWNKPANLAEQGMSTRIAARVKETEKATGTNGGKPPVNQLDPGNASANAKAQSAVAAANAQEKAAVETRLANIKYAADQANKFKSEALAAAVELNRQGITTDQQLYLFKYDAALAAGQAAAQERSDEIVALNAYHGKDQNLRREYNAKIKQLGLEKVEVVRAAEVAADALRNKYAYDSAAPERAAQAAAEAEIDAVNKQVAALQAQYDAHAKLPEVLTQETIAKLQKRAVDLEVNHGTETEIANTNRLIVALQAKGALEDKLKSLKTGSNGASGGTNDAAADAAKAKELLDVLTEVDTASKSAAASMAEAFGKVGKAIGGVATVLTAYAVKQQSIALTLAAVKAADPKDTEKIKQAEITAANESAKAKIKSYGDMAGAAKGFFKENSTGYKVMAGAEKAYRVAEMAMALENMLAKSGLLTAFTSLFVASKATETTADASSTATSVVNSGIRAAANGVAALAAALTGPYPMNLVAFATVAAVLAGIGVLVGGGGGGGGPSAKERQEKNGTGTILGDDSAKSESIAKSLEIMEKNSGLGLAHTISMDVSLKQLVAGIGGLAGLMARSTDLSAMLKTAGSASGGWLGSIVTSIFGGKTTVQDAGIVVDKTTLGAVANGGANVNSYVDTKKSGGWFSSDKYRTALNDLGKEVDDQFSMIILNIGSTIKDAASVLGMAGGDFAERMDAFKIEIDNISLKGLTGAEQQKALEAAFSKLGDQMAAAAVTGLKANVGEGAMETLARIANDFIQVSDVFAVLNTAFTATGLAGVALSEGIIGAAGDLETLTTNTGYFVENFLTEAERMAPIAKSVHDAMTALDKGSVDTADEFKAEVLAAAAGMAVGADGAAGLYAALIAVAPQFKAVTDYASELSGVKIKTASEIKSERDSLQSQYDELTMTPAQKVARQRADVDPSNGALFDSVRTAQTAVDARALDIRIMELSGNKIGALAANRELEMAGIDDILKPQQLRIYALQDEASAVETANTILGLQAQMYEANGDKAGAAAVLEQQHAIALAGMTPELASATKATWDAQAAAKVRNDEASESNAILALQAQMYEANGDKAGAAAVLEQQHAVALAGMTPELAKATQATWDAQAAAKVRNDEAAELNSLLGIQAQIYEASGNAAGAASVLEQQHAIALDALSPALAKATQKLWDTQAAAKAIASQKSISDAYRTEAQKLADANAEIKEGFDKLGISIPATKEAFLALSQSVNPHTKEGQDFIAALANLMPAFDVVQANVDATVQASQAASEALLSVNKGYQDQIDTLLKAGMTSAQVRRMEIAGMAGSTVVLYDRLHALQAIADAEAKAKADAEAAAQERKTLQDQLDQLTMSATELREKERLAIVAGNLPLFDRITALNAEKEAAIKANEVVKTQRALDIQLMEATGKSAGALAAKRFDELAALTGLQRTTQQLIYAAEDAAAALDKAKAATDAALAAVQKAVETEKTRITVIRDAAAESVTSIKGIFDLLKNQVEELYGTVGSTAAMQVSQGAQFIDDALQAALNTGYLPDQQELADAIAAARSGLDVNNYASQFEADKAALVMAGKLSQMKDMSGYQLTAAEKALQVANDQLSALDAQLALAQRQVDTLNGINANVLGLNAALAALATAIGAQRTATAPAPQTYATAATALTSMPAQTGGSYATTRMGEADLVKLSGGVSFMADDSWSTAQTATYVLGLMSTYSGNAQALASLVAYGKDENLPGFAIGTNYVPQDMVARVHEGEAIVPRAYNPAVGGFGDGSGERLVQLVEVLTAEVVILRGKLDESNRNTRRTADAINGNAEQPMMVEMV